MNGNTPHHVAKRGADLPAVTPRSRRTAGGSARPESGHRSECRLRETIKDATIATLATDGADRDRLSEMFEIVWEYQGRSPFAAACDAYREGNHEAVEIALADDRRLSTLARPQP